VARHNCLTYLKRIHFRTEAIKHLSFSELLRSKSDLPIFVLADGTKTENLRATFRKFLIEYNLLKDPRTNQNRTLYSLRHSYATFMLTLNKGTDIHLLAKQMGTSTEMIERHYSHLIARMRSVDLAGKECGLYKGLI
jgi:integrase